MAGFGYDDFRCALKSGKDVADDRVERRLTAAIAVLDRGWGKPQQTVSANVSVFDQMRRRAKDDARCS
jgi:hypothetical protein